MTSELIDLFFSFRGRIGRQVWWFGVVVVAAAAIGGIALFNVDSFDESANAVRGAPTMAAFLWALLCVYILTALCTKRLADSQRPSWLRHTVSIPGALAISGWGAGIFLNPLASPIETVVFWALVIMPIPAIIGSAILPSEDT